MGVKNPVIVSMTGFFYELWDQSREATFSQFTTFQKAAR